MILAYDADCGFCSATARWLMSLDFPGTVSLAIVPYQDPALPIRMPAVDLSHADGGVQLLAEDGRMLRDAEAIGEILENARGYRWLGILIGLPLVSIAARAGYRCVARNRRRISRVLGLNACPLPKTNSSK